MGTRVLMQQGLIRVSKPGQDVYSAPERDLLLSLSARNCQIIQRGAANFPPGTGPARDGGIGGIDSANFGLTVGFPAQQTAPDVWVGLITGQNGQGANNTDSMVVYKGEYTIDFNTSSFNCYGRWQYTTAQITSVFSLVYVVFRKRVNS